MHAKGRAADPHPLRNSAISGPSNHTPRLLRAFAQRVYGAAPRPKWAPAFDGAKNGEPSAESLAVAPGIAAITYFVGNVLVRTHRTLALQKRPPSFQALLLAVGKAQGRHP